jgi:hypothetical protein
VKPLATFADPERLVVDYLTTKLAARGETVSVGTDLPGDWQATGSTSFVQVQHDGSINAYPSLSRATVRVTVWAPKPTSAKTLAGLCQALLLSHPGDTSIASVQSLTGTLPGRDVRNQGFTVTFTVRANLTASLL